MYIGDLSYFAIFDKCLRKQNRIEYKIQGKYSRKGERKA